MKTKVSVTELRQNIYKLLDQVVETGVPLEIERNGQLLRIVPEKRASKLNRLRKRKTIVGDPEELVDVDWSREWSGPGLLDS